MPELSRSNLFRRLQSKLLDLIFEPADKPVGLSRLARQTFQADNPKEVSVFFKKRDIIPDYRFEKIVNQSLKR